MHLSLLDILSCPSCRQSYEHHGHEFAGEESLWGYLRCPSCAIVIPIVDGFAFFTEPLIHTDLASKSALQTLAATWFGSDAEYDTYCRQRNERGGHEPYAAFQPFNESTRAIEAILPWLKAHVPQNGLVLDPWSRTGWTGEWLASHFKAQRVVALWEGERSVLGYRGYRHWLGTGRRSANLDVLFVHPERGLPFHDDAFDLIYALDCFHRFSLQPFGSECWRVSSPDSALALAHTHLSNSEPDPWFDRGCIIRHGNDYRHWLNQLLRDDRRQGWVWSEIDLFRALPGAALPDTPETAHYNGFVLIADPAKRPKKNNVQPDILSPDTRLLLNPMYRLVFGRDCLRVDSSLMNGSVGHLFMRHPVYQNHLPTEAVPVSAAQWAILTFAVLGQTVADIAQNLELAVSEILLLIDPLIAADILLPAPVSQAGFNMQRFHAHQLPISLPDDMTISFLQQLSKPAEETAAIRNADGDTLPYSDLIDLIDLLVQFLRQKEVSQTSRLGIAIMGHPIGLALALAGIACGCNLELLPPTGKFSSGSKIDLLIYEDTMEIDVSASRKLALGADGREDGLLAKLGEITPAGTAISPAGNSQISLTMDDRLITLRSDQLIAAALSLLPAATPDTAATHSTASFTGFLSALIALARRETVLLS